MRTITSLNDNWKFFFEKEETVSVNLPHTWNNLDGQGGADTYKRGVGTYIRMLKKCDKPAIFLEVLGANQVATVYVNGSPLFAHEGGYSAFYVDLSGRLTNEENELKIEVDNSPDPLIYPANADFTFYGGIYRDVNLITFDSLSHFDILDNGLGLFVLPYKSDGVWKLEMEAEATLFDSVKYILFDQNMKEVASVSQKELFSSIDFSNPILWDGVKNPYLYTVKASLIYQDMVTDEVTVKTGFREVTVDPIKGFFLNGNHLKIKGVSRHQDREEIGNALTYKEHKEDINLILEMGANAVRLAHYQHSQYFYDLCDQKGLLVWAEVPVITRFEKKAQLNAENQLTELISQNYNHPSIFCYSVSNEITTIGGDNKDVYKGIKRLNDLSKKLDPSRLTTMAALTMLNPESKLIPITNLIGYNHYFGWYFGTWNDLDKWLANWHQVRPNQCLCLSEYGAEAVLAYQNDHPTQGDYSEGYQALFHEEYLKRINAFDWIFGSYVWNMFDFGSAIRHEGGTRGRNNKGLVTFDRKTRKDSFYIYKAYWSDEPFVHLLGSRFNQRLIGETTIKVYSNLTEVTLTTEGYQKTITGDKVFIFDHVPVKEGDNKVIARSGAFQDTINYQGVRELPQSFSLPIGSTSMVRNWFEADVYHPENYSLNDRVKDLLNNKEITTLLESFVGKKKSMKILLFLARPFRVRTLLKIGHMSEQMRDSVGRFLQTIKKV